MWWNGQHCACPRRAWAKYSSHGKMVSTLLVAARERHLGSSVGDGGMAGFSVVYDELQHRFHVMHGWQPNSFMAGALTFNANASVFCQLHGSAQIGRLLHLAPRLMASNPAPTGFATFVDRHVLSLLRLCLRPSRSRSMSLRLPPYRQGRRIPRGSEGYASSSSCDTDSSPPAASWHGEGM